MLAVRRALPGVVLALLLLAAVAYPWLSDSDGMRLWTGICISAVLASAWNIVAGYCGYPSFGNVAFLGLGAYTTAVLMNHHVPFLVTLLAGAALAGGFALLVGWPILRVRTHYFAIATLGLAEIVRAVVTNMSKISGGGEGITLPIPPGEPFAVDLGFYFGALGLLVLVTGTAWWLLRGRVGYGWRAIAASEDGALATGVDATRLKLLAWVLSAIFTGAAGSIYAYWLTFIEPGSVFSISLSLKMIVGTLFGGVGSLAGPLLGTVVMELLAHFAWANFLYLHALIFAALVVAIITFFPQGLWPLVERLWAAATRRWAPAAPAPLAAALASPAPAPRPALAEGPPILAVEGLCKNFGGLAAVAGVSFAVRPGEIVGLVGPNGSGKTTVLNLISGLLPVSAGSIRLDGQPVQGLAAHRIARAGVGRTFQIVRDFPGMTVRDSVRVGALYGGGREPVAARVDDALHLLGLDDRAGALSGNLSGADRRRVELAKAVAMRPRLLLLDEVMVGLNPSEAEALIEVIRRLNQSGIAVLMVEHVMRAVMSLCDRVVVLNRGELLAEGTPETVTRDERVIAAYLGAKFRGGRAANAADR